MKTILHLLQLSVVVLFSQFLHGQNAGDLDTSFGDGGKLLIDCGNDSKINDMAVLDNGQIIVAGSCTDENGSQGLLVLLNDDGSIDTSFGQDGFFYLSFDDYDNTEIDAVEIIYPAGKGSSSDGNNWEAEVSGKQWKVGDGFYYAYLSSISSSGTLDLSYGVNGRTVPFQVDNMFGMVHLSASSHTIVASLISPRDGSPVDEIREVNDDGTFNSDFGSGGVATLQDTSGNDYEYVGTSLNVDQNGRLIVGGYFWTPDYQFPFAAAFTADGILDPSFGNQQGIMLWDGDTTNHSNYYIMRSADIAPDNSIYLGGSHLNEDLGMYDKVFGKLKSDGSPDLGYGTFGLNYYSGEDADAEAIKKAESKLYATGEIWSLQKSSKNDWVTTVFLTRYNDDGSVDETFGDNGEVYTDFGNSWNYANVMKVYEDKILVGGYTTDNIQDEMALVRYVNDFFVSVDNHKENAVGVKIYPVPADQFVTVELTGKIKDKYSVSIMNNLGQVVYSADNSIGPDVKKLTLSTIGLSPGLNIVRVENKKEIITKKMLILE